METIRPIFVRVAYDNFGSQKVLEKCGFCQNWCGQRFANARQIEIEEFVYKLEIDAVLKKQQHQHYENI